MSALYKTRTRDAFTLVEVMVAMTVLALALASTMVAITAGFRVMEDARMTTLASQVLQSEMETLRLKNWNEIDALESGEFTINSTLASASFNRFTCTRTVELSGLYTNMKEITLRVDWSSTSGQHRTRKYCTYFSKGGLSDYLYPKT